MSFCGTLMAHRARGMIQMAMSVAQAEELVARELGPSVGVTKISGYWVILRHDFTGPRSQSRSLTAAIEGYRAQVSGR